MIDEKQVLDELVNYLESTESYLSADLDTLSKGLSQNGYEVVMLKQATSKKGDANILKVSKEGHTYTLKFYDYDSSSLANRLLDNENVIELANKSPYIASIKSTFLKKPEQEGDNCYERIVIYDFQEGPTLLDAVQEGSINHTQAIELIDKFKNSIKNLYGKNMGFIYTEMTLDEIRSDFIYIDQDTIMLTDHNKLIPFNLPNNFYG